ncbi:MAG: zinc ribbon domain-containing protein [Chloroflexi bacterium]|jgi:uncharacterized OB-fold protein|nr:zinc ribbon domain-containing protein [Chloroflexota bacterium]
MSEKRRKIIPDEFIPEVRSRVITIDNQDYLLQNDAMFTFYERSIGELSPFFLAIKNERKILGCKCSKCGIVRVPPMVTHCPDCEFAPTKLVEVGQVGRMNTTPPITYFATSLFLDKAPFGRGRVILKGADTALSVMLYTTTGILVPGLITKGTEVKVIFRDEREGQISDIYCVPTSELTPQQVAKKGLQESELNWEAPKEPQFSKPTDKDMANYRQCLKEMQALAVKMSQSKRARKAIEGWKRNIAVKTKAGEFAMYINNGDFRIEDKKLASPDFVMACEDPRTLLDGLMYKGAITDSVIMKRLWISKNLEFNTIFKLDRLARFLVMEQKEKAAK